MTDQSSSSTSEPDFWDFLDTPEMKELLARKAEKLPTAKKDIETYLESMPIMTTVKDEEIVEQSSELQAIEALVGDEQVEDRVESFKQSGNEAYKLAIKMKQEADSIEIKLKQYDELVQKAADPASHLATDPTSIYTTKTARDIDEDKMQRQRVAYHKRLQDAYQYYTQAIELNTFLPILNASCYSNRALISMLRENYGHCVSDCTHAVKKDHNNSKAFYRGAFSCFKIDKYEAALKWIAEGLKCKHLPAPEKSAFEKLQKQVEQAIEKQKQREKQKEQEQQQKAKQQLTANQTINKALQTRGLSLGKPLFDLNEAEGQYNQSIKQASNGSLTFPILFLYPTHFQSDSISAHSELAPLQPLIDTMFPPKGERPPWDTQGEFRSDSLDVFVATTIPANESKVKAINQTAKQPDYARLSAEDETLMVRCDPKQSLLACLTQPQLLKHKYSIPGIPTFFVLPKKK